MANGEKKSILKRWWFWVIIALLFFVIIIAASGKSSENTDPTANDSKSSASTQKEDDKTEETASKSDEAYEIGEGTVKVWTNSIGTTWILAAVPVTNTGNNNLYLSSGTLDVEDASGTLIKTMQMVNAYPQIIQPGETAYYFDETTLDETVSGEGFKIIPHVDIDKAKVDCIRFEVSEITVKDTDYSGAKVSGRVENTSDKAENMVYIVANLFDADGNFLVQQMTILNNDLQAGEKIGFETSNLGYSFTAEDVANYEVFAFPYQYQF